MLYIFTKDINGSYKQIYLKKTNIYFNINEKLNVLNMNQNRRYNYKLFATIVHSGDSINGHYELFLRFIYKIHFLNCKM